MGAVIVAVVARKERDLVALFQRSRATTNATAQSLVSLGVQQDGIAFRRLSNRAVIREGSPGMYYLDEPSWAALSRLRHRMVFIVLLLALAMAIVAFIAIRGQAPA